MPCWCLSLLLLLLLLLCQILNSVHIRHTPATEQRQYVIIIIMEVFFSSEDFSSSFIHVILLLLLNVFYLLFKSLEPSVLKFTCCDSFVIINDGTTWKIKSVWEDLISVLEFQLSFYESLYKKLSLKQDQLSDK